MTDQELTKQQWASTVCAVLADHPEWLASTIESIQAGVVEAIDREQDRSLKLSLGLVEALGSRPGAKRRDTRRIVDAVQVSQFHPTPWSAKIIDREGGAQSDSQ